MPTKKTASTAGTAKKTVPEKAPARKTPARKTTAKKAAAATTTATKTTRASGAKKAAPRTSTARTTAARTNTAKAAVGPIREKPLEDDSPDIQIARLKTELAERQRECDDLKSRLESMEQKLDETQRAWSEQSEELGKLRAISANLDAVTQDRDGLRQRIEKIQVDLPARIEEQIADRLKSIGAAHAEEVNALRQDRDQLEARVKELEKPRLDSAPSMKTAAFAQHFADVLATVSDQPPATPDAAYVASVTSFTVSAKALLRATDDGEVEFVTPDPGTVPSDALSTLSLDLRLLPRPPAT